MQNSGRGGRERKRKGERTRGGRERPEERREAGREKGTIKDSEREHKP